LVGRQAGLRPGRLTVGEFWRLFHEWLPLLAFGAGGAQRPPPTLDASI
jgi:hypothetical protein